MTAITVKSIGGRLAALRTGLAASGSRLAGEMSSGKGASSVAGMPAGMLPGIHPLVFVSFMVCLVVMMAAFIGLF